MITDQRIIFAFDFYGQGNIGDDLMLAGFLDGLKMLNCRSQVLSSSKIGIRNQKKRFPTIDWLTPQEFKTLAASGSIEGLLAGVGDTPLQMTCGREWSLDQLLDLRTLFKGMRRVMINVGAESEIRTHMEEFKLAISQFERISTRDEFSATIARELLPESNGKIMAAADLAPLALRHLRFPPGSETARHAHSLILAGDTLSDLDLAAVGEYLVNAKHPVDFIVNDVSDYKIFEKGLYERLAPKRLFGWLRRGRLRIPDYNTSDWRQLVQPYMDSEVVVSSRYHGLLCAAYCGSRIGAIARSSKVEALARELNIPFCMPPLTESKIRDVFKNARVMDRNILSGMEERALNGIVHCLKS